MEVVTREDFLDTYTSRPHGERVAETYADWFPVTATPVLAGIIGDLTTDGHIQPAPKLRIDYTSADTDELERFGEAVRSLFGIDGAIRENTTNPYATSYNYGVNSKPLSRVLISAGAPAGNKVKTAFDVPPWICSAEPLFRRYTERVFTNDGSAYGPEPRITLELRKAKHLEASLRTYLGTIAAHLERFYGITGSIFRRTTETERVDGTVTVGLGLNIRRRDAIIKFHENLRVTDPDMAEQIRIAAEV